MLRWLPKIFVELSSSTPDVTPVSVNWFPNRRCNYECEFCFHTSKNTFILPMEDAQRGLRLLAKAGMKKLNISGGEPFLNPTYIGKVFKFCKEELQIEAISVVCNGSKVTRKWMEDFGQYLDVMAISCDSFDEGTNEKHGRRDQNGKGKHISILATVVDLCREYGVRVKINTVVTSLNWTEDMNEQMAELAPFRWKVFQVLLLDGENTGKATNSLRDARHLAVTSEQFRAFLERHKPQKMLVPESNEDMRDSYLNVDEEMRFLNCSTGSKIPGASLLEVGVKEALRGSGFDEPRFYSRGGVYDWKAVPTAANELDW